MVQPLRYFSDTGPLKLDRVLNLTLEHKSIRPKMSRIINFKGDLLNLDLLLLQLTLNKLKQGAGA